MFLKFTMIGRLFADPSWKNGGNSIAEVPIVVSAPMNARNENIDSTFRRLSAFGKAAELIIKHCKKGDCLYIEGRIETVKDKKDPTKKYDNYILNVFEFLPRSSNPEVTDGTGKPVNTLPDKMANSIPRTDDIDDFSVPNEEDVPF